MITSAEATEYLASMGIEVPAFVLDALVEQVTSIESELNEKYSASTVKLIQVYLIGLFGLGQVNKKLSSQSAPSGASRSFNYTGFNAKWNAQLSLIRGLDKEQCTKDLIPPNPTKTSNAGVWVATGKAS